MTEKGMGVGKIVRIYVFNRNHKGTLTSCGVECLATPARRAGHRVCV